jgi:hypothetical protein
MGDGRAGTVGTTGRRTAALTAAVCALATGLASAVESATAQDGSDHVRVATTGNQSELRESIPITRTEGKKPRVVMSLSPAQLPSLGAGDRLKATAELEVTTDCPEKMPRCVGKPYTYNPIVNARIVLANGPFVSGGEGALELQAQRSRCRQKSPDRVHHCMFIFTDTVLDVASRDQLPCSGADCHLNLVVDAHNKRKKKGKKGRRNRLLIGEDEPDGSVGHDKGRLNAIRFSPGDQPPIEPVVTPTPLITEKSIEKSHREVIYSQDLTGLGLKQGDQIAANGLLHASIAHLDYVVQMGSRLIIAPTPVATGPGKIGKRHTDPPGELTESNGFNCTQRNPECTTNKVGVITITRDAQNGKGDPIPLYANYVFKTAKPGASAPVGDRVLIGPGGGLAITRYPASMTG